MERITLLLNNWKSMALRGIVALCFGIFLFFCPNITVDVLIIFFGFFVFIDGVFSLITARHVANKIPVILEGFIGIGIGLIAFFWPQVTALVMVVLIACWAITTGVLEILLGLGFSEMLPGKWFLVFSGILSIVIGLFLAFRPGVGLIVVIWLVAAYAVIFGILILGLALQIRSLRE